MPEPTAAPLRGPANVVMANIETTSQPDKTVRTLIWVYFVLLMIEGALRKWVLPQLSDALLIVRDPVVIAIYVQALRAGVFPYRPALVALYLIATLSVLVSLAFGQAPLIVNLFGLRTNFLHLPLIFLIGEVLSAWDMRWMGRSFLLLAPFMAVLMALQFMSPQDAWLNKGTIGEGGQISSSLGRIRPAGLFSYNSGAGQFVALTTAFLLTSLLKKSHSRSLLIVAAGSVLLAVVSSGSRTTVLSCGLVILAFAVICLKPEHWMRAMLSLAAIGVLAFFLAKLGIFQEGFATLTTRFDEAGGVHQGLVMRILDGFISPFASAPWFGMGLGLGTNVGAKLATGEVVFLVAEGELGRVLGESGIFVGGAYLIWRFWLLLHIFFQSIAVRAITPLPILLFAGLGGQVFQGQFGQSTTLGFVVFGSGLGLAAVRLACRPEDSMDHAPPPMPGLLVKPMIRGRSVYAEALHGR